jgi:PKD repeat protein
LAWYGVSTDADSSGGGAPGATGDQIVGDPTMTVTYYNTTTGGSGSCTWDFGDGTTSNSCGSSVTHQYSIRGTYSVGLTVSGYSLSRSNYILVGCKVPAFAGVRKNAAATTWSNAGFTGTITYQSGSGNYKIGYQSTAGGIVNPLGGCAANITVGP